MVGSRKQVASRFKLTLRGGPLDGQVIPWDSTPPSNIDRTIVKSHDRGSRIRMETLQTVNGITVARYVLALDQKELVYNFERYL